MFRRYNRWQSRYDQPDPYDGSYSMTNPQSFNRYAYVQGDPVNFTDPSGLDGEFTCKQGDPNCAVGSVDVPISWDDMDGYLPDWSSGSGFHFGFAFLIPAIPLLPVPQKPTRGSFEDCVGGLGATFGGLNERNVFGYDFYHSDGQTPLNYFTGDPLANGRMGARRLNAIGGSDMNKAMKYTKPSSQAARKSSYENYAGQFRDFFNCYQPK